MEHWLILLTISAAGYCLGFQCPDIPACSCQPSHSGDFQIYCPTDDGSAFIVNVQPNEYIQIECYKSPQWSDFQITDFHSTKNVKSMYFRMCELPSNSSLGNIAHQLGVEHIDRLIFQSFSNLSMSLTKQHLEGFPNLQKLILSSNSLTKLSKDLFSDLSNLTWLDLRENNVQLPSGIFEYTPGLEVLELGNNMIDIIEPGTFDPLSKLLLLNLWKNKLTSIQLGLFDKLVSLKSLDINSNLLTTLPAHIFDELANLEILNMFGNNFTTFPADLLQKNTKLRTVSLYNNKRNMTVLPSGFFANLPELRTLKLKRNGLVELPEDLFWGSTALTNVSLERNYLKTLPLHIFKDANQLKLLDLNFNDITSLPDGIFANTPYLTSLDLSKNHITSISRNLFSGLKHLEILKIEENQLKEIQESSFSSLTGLRIAKFSNNHLTLRSSFLFYDEYGIKSPFHDCTSLEELYLAKNNISEIFSDWIVSNLRLRILDLKYNNISYISAEDLQFLSSKIKVDLTYNKIQHIYLKNAELMSSFQKHPRDVIILVENNPIACDCNLYDFLRYLEGKMHPHVQNYFHIIPGDLICKSPDWLENIKVAQLSSQSLKCTVDITDIGIKCPQPCICWRTPHSMSYTIDCSYRNLTELPSNIANLPDHQLELNFTGNALKHMIPLAELGLANETVTKLLLSHNNISNVTLNGLSPKTQILELHSNNISKLDFAVLQYLKNSTALKILSLHENPWKCDCDARDFLNFIQTTPAVRAYSMLITCQNMDTPALKMTATDFCPVDTAMIVGLSLTIALTGLLIGMVAALYYRYQREIKVWLYAHQSCLWLVTEDELDKDKLYDAFISYSHKDEEFVMNELVQKLENGPRPFKLCLHFRDWLAGEWIPTQIARSVEESKRTIVVLSPNFLESVWGRMEFRAAHSQALSEGRARVILILYGEISPTDDLDPELKAYLSMNTYVKWGDPWFWDKLRYALPHPPELRKGAIRRRIFEKQQPCIQISGEKKELIYPNGGIETPPAASTPPADSLKVFICDNTNEIKIKNTIQTPVVNSNAKIILTSDHSIRDNSLVGKIQCTTV